MSNQLVLSSDDLFCNITEFIDTNATKVAFASLTRDTYNNANQIYLPQQIHASSLQRYNIRFIITDMVNDTYLPLSCLPSDLVKLELSYTSFDLPLGPPSSLKILVLGDFFNQILPDLPDSLRILIIGKRHNRPLRKLPSSLELLILNDEYDYSLNELPPNLKILILGGNYKRPLMNVPRNVIVLQPVYNPYKSWIADTGYIHLHHMVSNVDQQPDLNPQPAELNDLFLSVLSDTSKILLRDFDISCIKKYHELPIFSRLVSSEITSDGKMNILSLRDEAIRGFDGENNGNLVDFDVDEIDIDDTVVQD